MIAVEGGLAMAQPSPRKRRSTATLPRWRLSDTDAAELERLIGLVTGADSVVLTITVPESDRRSVLTALGGDPLGAVIRQIAFINTPDLRLDRSGGVVRVRRTQQLPPDLTVKLHPVDPESLPPDIRGLPGLEVEVDALTSGFVCSCSAMHEMSVSRARDVLGGRLSVTEELSRAERALLDHAVADDLPVADLTVLGPVHVLRSRFVPEGFARRLVAELWFLPDGTRILELSTRCDPESAVSVAAETRRFLAHHGVDLEAAPDPQTSSALSILADQLPDAMTPLRVPAPRRDR
jgi:hypothetical protein